MPPWDELTWDQGAWDEPVPPPLPILTQPKKRTHHMPKSDFIENNDDAFAAQTQKFKLNIGSYTTLFTLTAPQIAAQAADANYFAFVQTCQQIMLDSSQQWTVWKLLTRRGGSAPAAGAPMPPVFPAAVPAMPQGIEVRFRALVKLIKAHPNYNVAIGEALGIEGPIHTPPPGAAFQPVLSLELRGGQVYILWGWQGNRPFLDALELLVDRGDGHGYVLLVMDTTPNYLDPTPFPATPVRWKYKAIFRKNDTRVGQWSDEVGITVG